MQIMLLFAIVINLSVQSMNQNTKVMLRTMFPHCTAAKMMSWNQEHTSKPMNIFALPAHLVYNLQNHRHTMFTSATTSHDCWQYVQYSRRLFRVRKHSVSTIQSLITFENLKCNVIHSGCHNQSSQMLMQSRYQLYLSPSGKRTLVVQSANCQHRLWGFGRRRAEWRHNG
jgi:hypothetical protein